ncbi:MAG: hydantoinase/oxoprolinase family protein [Promethearchaeota archaeon]
MIILGLDIGGANTKAALAQFREKDVIKSFSYIEYFPFWEKNIADVPDMLKRIIENLIIKNNYVLLEVDYVAVTITAELSDAFQTKKEGILTILDGLIKVFEKNKLRFITNKAEFISWESAKSEFITIAAANWASTGLFLGKVIDTCILIDAGSTTIDIIPIIDSIPIPRGRDDISRLIHHELIYTGGLRATIPSITHHVPYKNKNVRVSFEKFALISDVHRILNNISEEEYINDTADNRSKSIEDCYARLARVICMDLDTISKQDLTLIAKYIYEKQLDIITRELEEFMEELKIRHQEFQNNPKFVLTGSSSEFLIKKPLQKLGYDNIFSYEEITNISDKISSSAFAVAGAFHNQL